MPLTQEQATQIKEQLLKQLVNFPKENREQIKKQVTAMSPKELEEFLKQNQLAQGQNQQCIFCSIAQGKTPSAKINENENNLAILELNPLSKGHTLIIPKEHLSEIPESAKELAQEVEAQLKNAFNPDKIEIKQTKIMEHPIIELIPNYKNQKQEKKQATPQELESLQKVLVKQKKTEAKKIETPKEEKPKPLYKLKPRIP